MIPPSQESTLYPNSFRMALLSEGGVPENAGDRSEDEAVERAQAAGVVGVDADEQADAGAQEEVDDQQQGDHLHHTIIMIHPHIMGSIDATITPL